MIARVWRGKATPNRADAYPKYFHRNVLPGLRDMPGFLAADLLRRELDGAIEYVVITRWASMDAIHAFAGNNTEKAVVEPDAIAALVDYDDRVEHYEIMQSDESA